MSLLHFTKGQGKGQAGKTSQSAQVKVKQKKQFEDFIVHVTRTCKLLVKPEL